jgi:outer membrane protein assembly factor BamB
MPPAAEALRRLNLTMAWKTYIPMDGGRDILKGVRPSGKQLLIQTRSGLVTQLDAETGQTQWRNRVGDPYRTNLPMTFNGSVVLLTNNSIIYCIDRADGSIQWQMPLPGGVSAPILADEDQCYLPMANNSLVAYRMPNLEKEKANRAAKAELDPRGKGLNISSYSKRTDRLLIPTTGQGYRSGPQPVRVWAAPTTMRLDLQPLVSNEVVLVPSSTGQLLGYSRYPTALGDTASLLYRFKTDGDLLTQPGQYGSIAYVASRDYNLYALNMATGRTLWRYTAGNPIVLRPLATQDDVYITTERNGLVRLDRGTGEPQWRIPHGDRVLNSQPTVDRVLAVNPKFVYATDRSGRLVVLDRERGTILSTWDTRDWAFVVPNDWTDRLYLAAHNGLLVCLHDREYPAPVYHRELETALVYRLARPVSIPAITNKPLKDVLRSLETDYKIKILISRPAFKDAGKEPIDDKPVTTEGKIDAPSLREALQKILEPFDATFEPIEETLLVIPNKAKGQDKPGEKPPDKEGAGMDKGM